MTRASSIARWTRLGLLVFACGCNDTLPSIGWERMIDQPRGKPYKASTYFPDGKLMQAPPEGTILASHVTGPQAVIEGVTGDGNYVTSVPLRVDHALLQRGRDRFETFCATCHGIDGSGTSLVAASMDLRKPPSLVTDPVRSFPVGHVFQVITQGYGLMPSYAFNLPTHDRWAVVSYLRALQRSQATELASLPETVRQRAIEALR